MPSARFFFDHGSGTVLWADADPDLDRYRADPRGFRRAPR